MSAIASQITSVSIVCSTICSGADKKSSASLALRGESTGGRWIPLKKASDEENVCIWWRHHVAICRWHHAVQLLHISYINSLSPGRLLWQLILNVNFDQRALRQEYRVNIDSGNDLVPLGNRQFHAPMLTQLYVTLWCPMATVSPMCPGISLVLVGYLVKVVWSKIRSKAWISKWIWSNHLWTGYHRCHIWEPGAVRCSDMCMLSNITNGLGLLIKTS